MKKLLTILVVVLVSLSTEAKPLPKSIPVWDIPLYKSPKNIPYTSVYLCTGCGSPYGRIDITVDRGFAYTTCEYTTVQVLIYQSFNYGWPRQTYWAWIWTSFSITIPAGSQSAYVNYQLRSGEQVHVDGNSEVISSDVQTDNLAYCY